MIYENRPKATEILQWSDFEHWNALFGALCANQGLGSVNDLAHVYCDNTGRRSQRDLDAAVRNINNWRKGSHTPSAKNLAILADILNVASDPALNEAWRTLYVKAKCQPEFDSNETVTVRSRNSRMTTLFRGEHRRIAFVIGTLIVTAASVSGFTAWHASSQASVTSERPIAFRSKVTLKVGQSVVIHGYRAGCGKPAPDRESTTSKFPPKIGVGTLTAGDTGVRYSRHCKGDTPAREVIFHAERVGSEMIELFGDAITLTVIQ